MIYSLIYCTNIFLICSSFPILDIENASLHTQIKQGNITGKNEITNRLEQ